MPNPQLILNGTNNDRAHLTELVEGCFPDAVSLASREALQLLTQAALRETKRTEKPKSVLESEEDEIE